MPLISSSIQNIFISKYVSHAVIGLFGGYSSEKKKQK